MRSVQEYLLHNRCDPLTFTKHRGTPISNEIQEKYLNDSISLKQLIRNILHLSKKYWSYSTYTETSPMRKRSSIDLLRHIKSTRPEVDIYSIMRILYELESEHLIRQNFCYTVERRVFTSINSRSYWEGYNKYDEYGLQFDEWENISE